MSNRLAGKVAVITGGSTGIGLATAKMFVAEGAYVFITGRRQPELDTAVKAIGKNVTAVQSDVAKLNDLDRLYETVQRTQGHIDILFANAGIGEFRPLEAITPEHYDKVFNINVRGLVFTVQKALRLFKDGGSIILNASVAASSGHEAFSVYSASKAAVRSFARGWASDLRARKIRVNAISPGPIETPIMETTGLTPEQIAKFKTDIVNLVPMGRMGRAEEVAQAAVFLASDESSYTTGSELFVDGGMAQV